MESSFVDFYSDPYSENDGNILLLWGVRPGLSYEDVRCKALAFSKDDYDLVGIYRDNSVFMSLKLLHITTNYTPALLHMMLE